MAQGLDRRITVGIEAEGTREHGEYQPGPVTNMDAVGDGSTKTHYGTGSTVAGSRTVRERTVVMRYQ